MVDILVLGSQVQQLFHLMSVNKNSIIKMFYLDKIGKLREINFVLTKHILLSTLAQLIELLISCGGGRQEQSYK